MPNNFVVVDKEELAQMIKDEVSKQILQADKRLADFISKKIDNLKIKCDY